MKDSKLLNLVVITFYISEGRIIDYANVYFNIPLSDNTEYQELLGKYTSKVSEYSSVVNNQ